MFKKNDVVRNKKTNVIGKILSIYKDDDYYGMEGFLGSREDLEYWKPKNGEFVLPIESLIYNEDGKIEEFTVKTWKETDKYECKPFFEKMKYNF